MSLDYALAAAGRGWPVFRVKARSKEPVGRWTEEATTDPQTIVAWLAGTDLNYGIACGPAGLVVVDEDDPGAADRLAQACGHDRLPATFTVTTGKGRHFYYAVNGTPVRNGVRKVPGIDVRAAGGYVVGPGSTHPSGARYEVADGRDALPLPAWPAQALNGGLRAAETSPRAGGEVVGPRPRLADEPLPEVVGWHTRHDTIMRRACSMQARGVSLEEALVIARFLHQRCQQPPDPCTPDCTRDHGPYPWDEAAAVVHDVFNRYDGPAGADGYAPVAPEEAERAPWASWLPVDLAETLRGLQDGTLARPAPVVGRIHDGGALFYPGKVNGVHGDSNAGKTWTALVACAQQLAAGEVAVYVDLEDDAAGIVSRLLDMGAEPAAVAARFIYLSPAERLDAIGQDLLAGLLAERRPTLVVVDSTGEGLALEGANPNADDEVARWFRRLPGFLAARGPAVLVLDHMAKADDGSLWPIGSQRKRAAIGGAQYAQRIVKPFSRDTPGVAVLICAKDRHGHYRKGQRVAELHVTPQPAGVRVELVAAIESTAGEAGGFRPTVLMERVSRAVEQAGDLLTFNSIADRVKGKRQHVRTAVDVLVAEGHLTATGGPRRAILHGSVKPYREADDDGEPVEAELGPQGVVTGSGSLGGEPGTSHTTGSGNQWGTSGNQSLGMPPNDLPEEVWQLLTDQLGATQLDVEEPDEGAGQ